MAGLLDLFSGRSSDIYGNGLLTPEQRGGLGNIGLLALAGKLGQLAGPSFSPVPDFGAALGQAAGAYGASQEGAGTAALNAILTGQRGRKLEQELDYYKQLGPVLSKLAGDWPGAGGGAGGGTGGGTGGGGGGADPSETDIIGRESGGKPYVGYGGVDLSNKPLNEFGFPIWEGRMGPSGISHAAGLYQFQPSTWATYAGPLGIKDFSPESQRKVYLAARAAEGARPWAASAGGGGGRAAPAATAAAPAGTGTSGFLAPTPGGGLLNLPDPSGIGARAGFALPQSGGGSGPIDDPYAGTDTPRGPAGSLGPAGPQGEVVVPIPPRPDPPPLAIPNLPPQAAAALAQAAPGLLVPGGGLLPRGGGAIPGMPPAVAPADAMPSDDPRLQLGPLAAPAPAAAAPAAPGPGLLSPPGAPAAALPRGANPAAYDAFLRNSALAGVLARGAGLPDIFGSLNSALKDTLGYQGAVERQKQGIETEFAGPKAGAVAAAQDPYIRAQKENEVRLKTISDLYQKGLTIDANGQMQVNPDAIAALSAADAANLTGNQKEYKSYVNDQKMRNLPYLSEFDWSLAQKKAGAATTELKIGEHAGEKMVDLGIKAMEAADEGAKAARSRTQQYGQIAQAAQNFVTGPTADGWLTVKSYLKDAGVIKGTDVPDGEVLRLAARRLEIAAAPKGQGSITDFERGMLREAIAGMATSPEGLARAIVIGKRLDDYDIQVAQIHRDVARANKNTPDYLEAQDRIAKLGPPLSPQERSALEALQPERGAAAPGAAPAPGKKPVWNPAANNGQGGLE